MRVLFWMVACAFMFTAGYLFGLWGLLPAILIVSITEDCLPLDRTGRRAVARWGSR